MHIEGTFSFDDSDGIYADHFPGNPIVPGSLIVHAFMETGKEAGFEGKSYIIENFKFIKFISPGEYSFSIKLFDDRLKCRLYKNMPDGTRTLVTGTIKK